MTARPQAMRLRGGIVLVCVGLGLAASGALIVAGVSARLAYLPLIGGAAMGMLGAIAAGPWVQPWGAPSRGQTLIMLAAVIAEILAIYGLSRSPLARGPFPDYMAAALLIVSAHFIPMRWSHGPWILRLAFVGLAWIGAAWTLKLPLAVLLIGDGLLKFGFGLIMTWPMLGARREAIDGLV